MTTYKSITTGAVISETDYNRLPSHKQRDYYRSYETVSHRIEEDNSGDFIMTVLLAEVAMGLMDSDSSSSIDFDSGTVDAPESNDVDFGGGDFGGGGAGSDW